MLFMRTYVSYLVTSLVVQGTEGTFINRYLLENGDERLNTTSFSDISGNAFDNLVIELISTHYVKQLQVTYATKGLTKRVYLSYLNDINLDRDCQTADIEKQTKTFTCDGFARLIKITGQAILEGQMHLHGYDTKSEYYVGCFEKHNAQIQFTMVNSVDECQNKCGPNMPFCGIDYEGNCICTSILSELIPVDLRLCNEFCLHNKYQYCGGRNYFSIYSKDIIRKNFISPAWECMFRDENCTNCIKGRVGKYCDLVECRNNNGNCGSMSCQNITLPQSKDLFLEICACTSGLVMDNEMDCREPWSENHEKSDVTPWGKIILKYSLAYVGFMVAIVACFGVVSYCIYSFGKHIDESLSSWSSGGTST